MMLAYGLSGGAPRIGKKKKVAYTSFGRNQLNN